MLSWIGDRVIDAVDRRSARVLMLISVFVIFGALDFVIGALISLTHATLLVHGTIDATVLGGLAALAAWLLLEAAKERRKRIALQMKESARLNHEIRNALEVIAQAGYLINDVVYGRAVSESIERIERSLRDRGDFGGKK